ncbi:PREDICTED: proline-rich receptor-like protein kinase PERK12 [Diuraphis noxia]|uniref:proline-rich receptor-like protein kinase PERK12 n=1 Tax=Diuraphis noxia TaxID=143948 RepID=UPI000763A7E6|nr:PREDICTED: proline-rich receptor-like protein kinase PERK12 [Diuraphis noxia]
MSDEQQISIPANRPEDCPAEQPPKDCVASSLSPPCDETEMSSKDVDAASSAPPQKDVACLASLPGIDAEANSPPKEDPTPVSPPKENPTPEFPPKKNATPESPPKKNATPESPPKEDAISVSPPKEYAISVSPPKKDATPESPPVEYPIPAPPQVNDTDLPASQSSLPLNKNIASVSKVKPGFSKANSNEVTNSNDNSDEIKQEIKHETIDLGNDTYYYDDNDTEIPVRSDTKVGFDRGLEPDHIVGATEENGKLMFLIAWKDSNVADLLESTVIYKRCPQLAIQFFEARLRYCPNDESN